MDEAIVLAVVGPGLAVASAATSFSTDAFSKCYTSSAITLADEITAAAQRHLRAGTRPEPATGDAATHRLYIDTLDAMQALTTWPTETLTDNTAYIAQYQKVFEKNLGKHMSQLATKPSAFPKVSKGKQRADDPDTRKRFLSQPIPLSLIRIIQSSS